jgi:hypothetical protein
MGTAHGAEELDLCFHGRACQAGAWDRYIGFCLGYGRIGQKSKLKRPAKMFCEAHNFVPFSRLNCGALEMQIAVSRE